MFASLTTKTIVGQSQTAMAVRRGWGEKSETGRDIVGALCGVRGKGAKGQANQVNF
jgi:hypothetical protein